MSDVVVTIPKSRWKIWLSEGCLAGQRCPKHVRYFIRTAGAPRIESGERVYIVAFGKLRGYAPLYFLDDDLPLFDTKVSLDETPDIIDRWRDEHRDGFHHYLVRKGGAVAVTIREHIPGFQGFRYRWWKRSAEMPFPDWMAPTAEAPSPSPSLGEGESSNDKEIDR